MARIATTLLVLGLLGGTAGAFAVTEGLKLEKTPIFATRVDKVFSPVCDCETRVARISFTLRKADRVKLEIVRGDELVRTLSEGDRLRAGRVIYTWNGRDDFGRFVPEGTYRPKVRLDRRRRTIVLPNEVEVDTTPPRISIAALRPLVFSPDGDRHRDKVVVHYRLSEPSHALLLVNGERHVRTRGQKERSQLEWFGKHAGRALPAATYRLALAAEDRAGNVSRPTRAVPVQIRYIALARDVVRAKAGKRFGVRVSTDARRFRWRLGKRRGTARPGLLVLRAPKKPGRVNLVVEANGHADRARVVVRAAR